MGSAGEFGDWVANNRAEYAAHARPILEQLAAAGYPVETLRELRHGYRNYKSAIPILLRWLPKVSCLPLKEDLIRTLSVPWAAPQATSLLIEEFRTIDDPTGGGVRWAIGNALEVVAGDSAFDELVSLAQETRYGIARQMVVLAIGKMRRPGAAAVLIELLSDPDVAGHAVMALGRIGDPEARQHLERFLTNPKAWIRKEAKKALAKL